MPLKCAIYLSKSGSPEHFEFRDEHTVWSADPTCCASACRAADKSEGARTFRLTRPKFVFFALLLLWLGSKRHPTRSIKGGEGSDAAELYGAAGRVRVKGGHPSWMAKCFVRACAELAGRRNRFCRLFVRQRKKVNYTFHFGLTGTWSNAELKLFVGGIEVPESHLEMEAERWADDLMKQAARCVRKKASRHAPNPRAEFIERAMTCTEGDFQVLQEAISRCPLPTDSELSNYSKETVRATGLRTLGHLIERRSDKPYATRLTNARYAARLFAFARDPRLEFECFLLALSFLRPLNRPTEVCQILGQAVSVMAANPPVAKEQGPHLIGELGATHFESISIERFSRLREVEHDCYRRLRRGAKGARDLPDSRQGDRRDFQLIAEVNWKKGRKRLFALGEAFRAEGDEYGLANTLFCVLETFVLSGQFEEGLRFLTANESDMRKGSLWIRSLLEGAHANFLGKLGREPEQAQFLAERSFSKMAQLGISPSMRRGGPSPMLSPGLLLPAGHNLIATYGLPTPRARTPIPHYLVKSCCDTVSGR